MNSISHLDVSQTLNGYGYIIVLCITQVDRCLPHAFYGSMVVTDNVVNISTHLCYMHGHQNNCGML